ncbi:MAG: hypothetical protein RBS99_12225 [Rhodospirillales bacterium]|nr:hypothetical protein [Rhodospirillales bacterium]
MKGKPAGEVTRRTRREVLGLGGKVLPALAVMGLALAAATPTLAADTYCGACSSSCSGSCYQGCLGSCMTGCEGGTK